MGLMGSMDRDYEHRFYHFPKLMMMMMMMVVVVMVMTFPSARPATPPPRS